jgi:hypothetical protein
MSLLTIKIQKIFSGCKLTTVNRRLELRRHSPPAPPPPPLQLICIVLLLAACDAIEAPLPTLTDVPSGPTIQPSPMGFPVLPTEIPPDFLAEGQNDPTAAALPRDAGLPPLPIGTPEIGRQQVEITASDGTLLYGELYQLGANRLPGILIIGDDLSQWGDFPAQIQRAGFTVLAMQMRPEQNVSDFQVMMDALNTGTVDPGRIGVIGAGQGADLALLGCSTNRQCDALVLLSPFGEQSLSAAIRDYSSRPIFISASRDDSMAFATGESINASALGEKFFQPFDSAGRGAELVINRPDLAELITGWLTRYVIENASS